MTCIQKTENRNHDLTTIKIQLYFKDTLLLQNTIFIIVFVILFDVSTTKPIRRCEKGGNEYNLWSSEFISTC